MTALLYWINLSAGTVNMPHNDRRSRFSGGRSSGLELSAAASPGCFVDRLISAGTENLSVFTIFSCCLTRPDSKVVLQEQCNSATLIKFIFNDNNNNNSNDPKHIATTDHTLQWPIIIWQTTKLREQSETHKMVQKSSSFCALRHWYHHQSKLQCNKLLHISEVLRTERRLISHDNTMKMVALQHATHVQLNQYYIQSLINTWRNAPTKVLVVKRHRNAK